LRRCQVLYLVSGTMYRVQFWRTFSLISKMKN